MGTEIVLSVELRINDGESEAFNEAIGRLAAFVEASEPGVLFYKYYLADDGRSARSIHIYRDLEAFKVHLRTAASGVQAVLEHASLLKTEVLSELTVRQLGELGMMTTPRSSQPVAGFARF